MGMMSESPGQTAHAPPPTVIVSKSTYALGQDAARHSVSSRRRSKTESAVRSTDLRSSAPFTWSDIDESSSQRKRSTRKTTVRQDPPKLPLSRTVSGQGSVGSEGGRFSPKLGQIQETSESRPSTRGSDQQRQSERGYTRRSRYRDDASVSHRRPVKHRVGNLSKRSETVFKVNPSLLSVLSSLSRASEQSSSSNNTITQQTYDQSRGVQRLRRSGSDVSFDRSPSPSVFSYMDRNTDNEEEDNQSAVSSTSSQYDGSDAGSSELPGTPSSRSTFPSPTITRSGSLNGSVHNGSVAELRRRYDPKYSSSPTSSFSARDNNRSPDLSTPSLQHQASVEDCNDDDAEPGAASVAPSDNVSQAHMVPQSHDRMGHGQQSVDKSQQQLAALRQRLTQRHSQTFGDSSSTQERARSTSSRRSAGSDVSQHLDAQFMAMQHYQHPAAPAPMHYSSPSPPVSDRVAYTHRPPAPEAPDLTRKTVAGYELVARELADTRSIVKPVYRKFEYLNHRILLHLQDELCEMEEQLRTYDEIIVQMDSLYCPDNDHLPASRRRETFSGSEIHHQRTALLGRIFLKTEQYSRAMTAYNAMIKDCRPAPDDQVSTYREWLTKETPIHEVETRFLQSERDLVIPPEERAPESGYRPTKHAALTCLPVALMLPLLLFSIIPTLGGRLAVTALLTVGAFVVAATTRIRHLMPAREWAVCGAAYVLLTGAIAGCIPQYKN